MAEIKNNNVLNIIKENNSTFKESPREAALILAAGHGKRIKSKVSKMLHSIWGKPTVLRVYDACKKGIKDINVVIVVGIKAEEVVKAVGKKDNLIFTYQEEQMGTGHAAQVGLEPLIESGFEGIVYVFPGDMGLIDAETIKDFKEFMLNSLSDMIVMTGVYEGKKEDNYYGRIVRVPDFDVDGNPAGEDAGKVIEIIEHKDILKLSEDEPCKRSFKGKDYAFSKEELLGINEFNAGVYAFRSEPLFKHIKNLTTNNVQNEIYITDLISEFNKSELNVGAVSPADKTVVMGFNNKSVLKEMETIAREKVYEKIKDIIFIDEPDDFFICEDCIGDIIELDKKGIPLDIFIGKGAHVGKGVKLNYGVQLFKNVYVSGNVNFGKNVKVYENVYLSCYADQQMVLGDDVEIFWGDIIKGNITIGDKSRIESSVNMTGSDEYPLRIGKNVLIKGTSYIFGSIIEDDLFIEHSVIIRKKIERNIKKDGTVRPVKFYLPMPEGLDSVSDIKRPE